MQDASHPSAEAEHTGTTAARSPWAPLSIRTFRALWLASVASNTGAAMQAVGAGWLMAEMSPSPLVVALVQAATMLPIFLLVLPAGVLGDILDRRKVLIFSQWWSLASALVLGLVTLAGWISPVLLLLLTFALGAGTALAAPPFQAIVSELVPRDTLPSAVALNSTGINIARAVGPAIGGLMIAAVGPASVFLFNAASFFFVLYVLWRWQRTPRLNRLPPEHFFPAMRVAWRYTRRNSELLAVLVRAGAFFTFAAALWALLPLVGKEKLPGSAQGYAILLSCLGAGAVSAVFTLPRLRERISADLLTVGAATAFAAAGAVAALSNNFYLIAAFMAVAGWSWLASLSTLNVSAQFTIAEWVKSRGLAMYQIVFFGCLAIGSIVWGQVANATSTATALLLASAGLVLGCVSAVKFRLTTAGALNLQPALSWPEPRVLLPDASNRGVILTTIEYEIALGDMMDFIAAMHELENVRRRNGGYGWGVFEDIQMPGRFVEHFFSDSWLEHLRHHARATVTDRAVQDRVNSFHKGDSPPRVSHFAAPGGAGEQRRVES